MSSGTKAHIRHNFTKVDFFLETYFLDFSEFSKFFSLVVQFSSMQGTRTNECLHRHGQSIVMYTEGVCLSVSVQTYFHHQDDGTKSAGFR